MSHKHLHSAEHTNGTDDIQLATASVKGLMSLTYAGKLDGIEAGADVTDATNVAAAGAVMKSSYTAADEIMVGTGAGTTTQVTLGASQILGKKDSGAATNLSASDVRTIINVEDGADVTDSDNVAAAGALMDTDFTAVDEVMVGTGSGTHAQVTLGASQILGKKASGSATNLSASDVRTIINVENGADVTDATNVAAAGAAMLSGKAGGQTLYGGTAASENLTLGSTSHETKGTVTILDAVNMSSKKITALALCTSGSDAANKDYVDNVAQGLNWQEEVLDYTSTQPAGTEGDRYLIAPLGTLALTGITKAEKTFTVAGDQSALFADGDIIHIYDSTVGNNGWYTVASSTYDTDHTDIVVDEVIASDTYTNTILAYGTTGGGWTTETNAGPYAIAIKGASTYSYVRPSSGWSVYIVDEETLYMYATSAHWVQFGATIAHNSTISKQGGTSNEYYHLTSAEYTGTGTGNFVRASSPTIVTPTISSTGFTNANHSHQAANSGGVLDHGLALAGSLLDDDHTQYVLLAGRNPAQTIIGGTTASANLTLQSTSDVTRGAIICSDRLGVASGAVGTPGVYFTADTDCGIYYAATYVGIAVAGAAAVTVSASAVTSASIHLGPVGSVGAPTYSFTTDPDTGVYRSGVNVLSLAAGGVTMLDCDFTNSFITAQYRIRMNLYGTAADPAIKIGTGYHTGLYYESSSGDHLCFAVNGVEFARFAETSGVYLATFASEIKIKIYKQASQPAMENNEALCIWEDNDDSNKVYLCYKRVSAPGGVVSVELS